MAKASIWLATHQNLVDLYRNMTTLMKLYRVPPRLSLPIPSKCNLLEKHAERIEFADQQFYERKFEQAIDAMFESSCSIKDKKKQTRRTGSTIQLHPTKQQKLQGQTSSNQRRTAQNTPLRQQHLRTLRMHPQGPCHPCSMKDRQQKP
jgi:hypothetical protein